MKFDIWGVLLKCVETFNFVCNRTKITDTCIKIYTRFCVNLECKSPNPHLKMEADPVSETLCILFSGIPDDGQSPKTQ
jgi:hypothetical protein